MKRLLLTSAGFENPEFAELFLTEVGIPANQIKVLFIPTAAIYEEAKEVLPKCLEDLTNCGVLNENITNYDLDHSLTEDELYEFNAIYVCGGSTEYLLERMNAVNFGKMLQLGFEHNLIYIGVSAGSVVCGVNLPNNLGYYNKMIGVHFDVGNYGDTYVNLTNRQAIWICGDDSFILPKAKSTIDSRCGLHCTGCEYKETMGCGGCIETNGNPFHGVCPVAACCQSKGYMHCGECPDIPCQLLTLYSCDPKHGDHPQGARIEQCKRWCEA